MGVMPRLVVRHTSETEEGQIYMPQINFALLVGVVILVVAFRNSDSLAAAYGLAVTGTFVATTILAFLVFHRLFRWPLVLVVAVFGPLLLLDLGFFLSNVLKVPEGGWVPLLLGILIFAIRYEGREQVEELAPGIHRVALHYGFQETPNIPKELEGLRDLGVDYQPMQASYFLGRETLVASAVPKMAAWQQWLFAIMARNSVPATEFFRIPSDRVVELGVRVAI